MLGTVSLYNMYCIYLSTDNFVQLQDLLYIRVGDNTTEMHTNLYSFDEHLSTPEMFSDWWYTENLNQYILEYPYRIFN